MTYPLKFREKVLSVREKEGLTIAEVAARFDVGVASVVRWLKLPEPKRHGRRCRKIDLKALAEDVRDNPDAYQYERAQRFDVQQSSMNRALKHLRANAYRRRTFQAKVQTYEQAGRLIVCIDERGFAHDMPRTHTWLCPKRPAML